MAQASRDQNNVPTLLAASNVDGVTPVRVYADPVTHRLLVDVAGGSGTVTSFSFTDANGFDGTVTNPTTTPNLSLAITVSGMLKGVTGAITAAVANTDYQVPITLTTTGTSGAATFNGTTLNIPNYSTGGGGTVDSVVGTANRITVDSTDPANPIVDIAATYVGQTSITTLGTIATGVWAGTAIAADHGGTGQTTYTKGDLLVASASTTLTKLGVGSNDFVLTADSGQATGVKWAAVPAASLVVGSTVISSGATTRILYDNAGVLGEYTITGTGTVVAMQTSPRFITDIAPTTNDNAALGTASLSFSDLFLASGALINFANGNVVLTHSSGILTLTTGTLALGANNLTMTGSIAATGARVTKGWFTDIESTNVPTVGGVALPTASSTTTFTNKRNQPRTASSTTASTLTPDLSAANVYYRTTQTATLTINAPTGTPVIGEVIAIYVDAAGAQTLTMDATYIPFGTAFPASLTAGKTFMLIAQYNGTNWKSTWANAV